MRGLKIHIIIVTFLVTLGLVWGGSYLSYQRRVALPLLSQLKSVPGVENAEIVPSSRRQKDVVIELKPGVETAITAYLEVERLAAAELGTSLASVRVTEHRTPALDEVFYRMHLQVQQGIATGIFTTMADNIAAIAAAENLSGQRVLVEPERVIVALENEDGLLFAVVPRPDLKSDAQPAERGALALW